MSETQETKSTGKKNGGAPLAAPGTDDLAGFVKIDNDLPTFKAENWLVRREGTKFEDFKGTPVRGNLLGAAVFTMSQTNEQTGEIEERDGVAYIIELTRDNPHCFDRGSETARLCKAGEKIRVIQTATLAQDLPEKVANHPTHFIEVVIKPLFRGPHPKLQDRKMWKTEVLAGPPQLRPKSALNPIAALLASAGPAATAALPSGS